MAKRQASLSFCQSTNKRQRESEKKADDDQDQEQMTLIAMMYRLKVAQNMNIHVMIHHIWCQHWALQFLVISRPLK